MPRRVSSLGAAAAILHLMKVPRNASVFTRRLLGLVSFVAALWIIQVLNWATGYWMNGAFGLLPRHATGVDGIVGMPFLHGSFTHLVSNTVPLLFLGTLLAATATRALLSVNAIVVLLGGALVWMFGSTAYHIGASGLVFGWFGFLVARGAVDRSAVTLGAALLVGAIYGSLIWGVLPGQPGVSWEAHLFGAAAGVLAAFLVRTNVHAPRLRNVEND